ncbi:MAG: zinc ribbon domain-containing protein [Oscillibacter sp.]
MNERLHELLDSVQRTAGVVGDAASDVAYGVGKKATMLLSVGKLNIKTVDLKAEISVKLREVGEMMYATHTGYPTDSDDLLEKLGQIDELHAQIAALSAEIARLQGGTVCPSCGAPAKDGDVFCKECGGKL